MQERSIIPPKASAMSQVAMRSLNTLRKADFSESRSRAQVEGSCGCNTQDNLDNLFRAMVGETITCEELLG